MTLLEIFKIEREGAENPPLTGSNGQTNIRQ
jgi:hypothetical protein